MSGPTTPEGRALALRLDGPYRNVHRYPEAIVAIEAEAAAAARAALLDELETWVDVQPSSSKSSNMPKDAVREWINRRRPASSGSWGEALVEVLIGSGLMRRYSDPIRLAVAAAMAKLADEVRGLKRSPLPGWLTAQAEILALIEKETP